MDNRTVTLHASMKRIAHLVNAHPVLRARAAESKAFELFVATMADLDALHEEQCTTDVQLNELRALTRILINDVLFDLKTFRATAALIPGGEQYFVTRPWPSKNGPVFHFTARARAMIDQATRHASVFIAHGLNPCLFESARSALEELIEVDHRRCYGEVRLASLPGRVEITANVARKRRKQLEMDLRRVMTPDLVTDWRAASSLGRVHRPQSLPSPTEQKLLPPPETE